MKISPFLLRPIFIKAVLSIFLLAAIVIVHGQSTGKPNIIFILADDVGYNVPTVNGGQSYSTPNIDSMARHGMNFTHCESSPLCCTSRSMFLTGKFINRNYSNWGYMNEDEKTVGNVMKDAGYTTGFFGKFGYQYSVERLQNWGWDRHILFNLTEDTLTDRRYKNPVLKENGYRIPDNQTANNYCDDILTDRIMKFIDSNKTRPFFAVYSMSIGHSPFSPTPDDPAFSNWDPNHPGDTIYFKSMMKYMDKKIGIILNKLKTTGLANNTIVMFSGDNGIPVTINYNANGVTNIMGEKGQTTEGGTHVPLIVYWPGHIQENSVNDDLIDFTDFLPTFAQAGKLNDLNAYGILDGISFYPKLLGKKGNTKKQLYCFYKPENQQTRDSLRIWVRNKLYKLYDSTGITKSGKFYNIVNDPRELSPISDNDLTPHEKKLKADFELILDTSYYWPDNPGLKNVFSNNITSSSAMVGATIISRGSSALKERGSSISIDKDIYLSDGRLRDNTVALGKFSQKRTGLKPQTRHYYIVYAMNKNRSHSTGWLGGSFFTLSTAAVKQPSKFIAAINNNTINLEWEDAVFPETGASKAGYLLIYSTEEISLIADANGKAPEGIVAKGKFINLPGTKLPLMPAKKANLSNFSYDSLYRFMVIPYTWDGENTATYNYLIKNALTTQIKPASIAFNNYSTLNEAR